MYSVNEIITIKKDDILNEISSLNSVIKTIFQMLYSNKKTDTINNNGNFWSEIDILKNKTSVYILLEDGIPLYVGIGGKTVNQKQNLHTRIRQHVVQKNGEMPTSSGSGYLKFKEIDAVLGYKLDANYNSWYSNLDVISIIVGDINNKKHITNSVTLEKLLIALFRPKYNG